MMSLEVAHVLQTVLTISEGAPPGQKEISPSGLRASESLTWYRSVN